MQNTSAHLYLPHLYAQRAMILPAKGPPALGKGILKHVASGERNNKNTLYNNCH